MIGRENFVSLRMMQDGRETGTDDGRTVQYENLNAAMSDPDAVAETGTLLEGEQNKLFHASQLYLYQSNNRNYEH